MFLLAALWNMSFQNIMISVSLSIYLKIWLMLFVFDMLKNARKIWHYGHSFHNISQKLLWNRFLYSIWIVLSI